ncbi:UDP-3-O-(3-hydroxymyristoyl)glucosamine N-acyltransferase [Reinekea sp.]|jgi:UDP-3-O-[3-hydroxymyristoyl] glucosamine N-acyltransferase|uniref:UDP-3-O-(3-hydroxymyristoyl)glucosamine N-acyltransferase n=1 Tax=Reinekea sp. TaxID=1970455 RepID=UPI002A834893|nr:UDP-3-O-(3-hydroxymyristoyl)glucosamine N-acyltransferase [Reinekea sp.]
MLTVNDLLARVQTLNSLLDAQKSVPVTGLAALDKAQTGELSFLSSPKYRRQLAHTQASVVLVKEVDRAACPASCVALVVVDPYLAYALLSHLFDSVPSATGRLADTAQIDPSATVAAGVTMGPYAVVGRGVVIGPGAEVGAHCFIDDFAVIGAHTRLQARVTVAHRCVLGAHCVIQSGTVIGSNGFGYAPTETGWQAIAQLGRVLIGDRVEIGANCTLDRGAIEDTRIDSDVIIDNLVHIGHNVQIGARTALAGQVGVAGSTHFGPSCSAGGQAGFTGHIEIAANSHFTGQAMVTKGTTEGGLYSSGLPAQASKDWRKMVARVRQLETTMARLGALEKLIEDTE